MKNIIYYFTGTGNSLAVARKIAKMAGNYELIPVTEAIRKPLANDVDCVGIAFPVYAYRPPHIVTRFLKKIRQENHGRYIFAIATNGGGPGNVLAYVKRHLKSERFKAGFTLQMPFNFLPFGDVPPPERQEQFFETVDKKLAQIIDIVNARKSSMEPVTNLFKTYVHPGLLYTVVYPMIPKMDKGFWADEKRCSGCNTCAEVCPAHNIVMRGGVPEWQRQKRCEQCWACVHWCPQRAVQYQKSTQKKGRYHHPEVSLKDLKAQKV